MTDDYSHLKTISQIAAEFGRTEVTVYKWKREEPDFPKPVTGSHAMWLYDIRQVRAWYANRWPRRTNQAAACVLHHWTIKHGLEPVVETVPMGNMAEARGYLKAIRDIHYTEWRIFHTPDGFSAHHGNDVEVWALDWEGTTPQPWYIYDGRYKAAGRVK